MWEKVIIGILSNKQKWWQKKKGKHFSLLPASALSCASLQNEQPENTWLDEAKSIHTLLFFLKWNIQQWNEISNHEKRLLGKRLEDIFCQSMAKNWRGISPPGLPVAMRLEETVPVISLRAAANRAALLVVWMGRQKEMRWMGQ